MVRFVGGLSIHEGGHRVRTALLLATLLVGVGLVSGCVGTTDETESRPYSPEQGATLPFEGRGPLAEDAWGREPALLDRGDGLRLVAAWTGGEGQQQSPVGVPVWRSTDDGASWERIQTGGPTDGDAGNSDTSLAVGPDGTIHLAVLSFVPIFEPTGTVQPPVFGGGAAVAVGTSTDGGQTWTWSVPVRGPLVDRPWIGVDPGGVVHLVWNDAQGVHHATSSDGGETWEEGALVHERGGDGGFAIGPDGTLAVRIVPPHAHGYLYEPGADGVAVSQDAGRTWTFHELPGNRTWPSETTGEPAPDGTPRIWDPVAFDDQGTLYAAWGEDEDLVIAWSRDTGETWTTRTVASEPSNATAFFPYLAARGQGQVAATWFAQEANGSVAASMGWFQVSGDAIEGTSARLVEGTGGTWGEYFQVAWDAQGQPWTVVPVDTGDGPMLHLFESQDPGPQGT